jgi:glycosyltransferase involved in cell wall biosynthesis
VVRLSPHLIFRGGEKLPEFFPREILENEHWKVEPANGSAAMPQTSPVEKEVSLFPDPWKPEGDVSIIIPAWKSAGFLRECIDSLAAQTHLLSGAKYEILLGIDACKSTRKQALKIARNYEHLAVYWFEQNNGPYLVKNTLAELAQYDRLLFFDADDVAIPEMLEQLLKFDLNQEPAAVYMYGQTLGADEVKRTCGVFLIRRANFLDMGGFMPWRCAADTEFMARLPMARIKKVFPPGQILMRRRAHENQLTQRPDSGFGSTLRAGYMRQINELHKIGIVNVGLVTVEPERIY